MTPIKLIRPAKPEELEKGSRTYSKYRKDAEEIAKKLSDGPVALDITLEGEETEQSIRSGLNTQLKKVGVENFKMTKPRQESDNNKDITLIIHRNKKEGE